MYFAQLTLRQSNEKSPYGKVGLLLGQYENTLRS